MSKQQKKAEKKVTKPVHEKGVTPSGLAVAKFLIGTFGEKEAKRITTGMASAAETKSMKRRLGRIATCVASASASAAA